MLILRLLLLLCFTVGTGVLLRDHGGPPDLAQRLEANGPVPISYHGKNRLKKAHSLYLRSAAEESVWWYEWGPEPFLMARALNRPILLDIGAAWCHGCRVMDRQTYADPVVAAAINEHFIAIKVDRDERPDLDHRYQTAVQAIANKGGWPLTAFLTFNGDVYYGGSLFAAQSADEPGLLELLPRLAEAYQREGSSIQSAAEFLRGQLRQYLAIDVPAARLEPRHMEGVVRAALDGFDREAGGFGATGPKFPEAEVWQFLLRWQASHPDPQWRAMIDTTLGRMANSGMYDQLGGGFHRYATDRAWRVPHFEKLLVTNAALMQLYLEAYIATENAAYREVVEGIARYVLGTLRDPATGVFFDHQDADSPDGTEGTYYTWTKEEIAQVLTPEEQQVAILTYDVRDLPRDLSAAPDRNVLTLASTPAALARQLGWTVDRVTAVVSQVREKLSAARAARPAPVVEPAAYTTSNGMMISALLRGAMRLDNAEWLDAALAALARLWKDGWDARLGVARGRVNGHWHPEGLLVDHVGLFHAVLDAYEASGHPIYLEQATQVAAVIERRFADAKGGGFLDRPPAPAARSARGTWGASGADPAELVTLGLEADPVKNFFDHNAPAENPALAMAFDRLAYLSDNAEWRISAEGILLSLAGMHPGGVGRELATYATAELYHLQPPAQVAIVGPANDPIVLSLRATVQQTYRPGTILRLVPDAQAVETLPATWRARVQSAAMENRPLAILCVGTTCARPTADPSQLRQLLLGFNVSRL